MLPVGKIFLIYLHANCPAILIPAYCSTEHLTYLSFSIFRTILITVKMLEFSIKLVKVILLAVYSFHTLCKHRVCTSHNRNKFLHL